jgi:hypothetical protein
LPDASSRVGAADATSRVNAVTAGSIVRAQRPTATEPQ